MVFETRRDLIVIAIAGLFFLFSSLFLSFVSPTYSSPDETANAFFSEILATQGHFFSFEPLNVVLGDVLFPRSIVSVEARLLPIGFLGLPLLLAGLIRLFGFWSLPIWTPLFAFLAIFAWYAIIRRLFNRQIGFLSSLLLMFFPAWWYWTARPLMSNVVFVCFLIFGVFFLVVKPLKLWKEKVYYLDWILAGMCLGFSVWLRTFEAFWLACCLFLGLIFFWKFLSWRAVVLFSFSFFLVVGSLLFLNRDLYGGILKNGYTATASLETVAVDDQPNSLVSNSSPISISEQTISNEMKNFGFFSTALKIIAPFGLHLQTTINHLKLYFFYMFWWLIIPAIIGSFLFWPRLTEKKERLIKGFYLILTVVTIVWLGSVYGSWSIFDNPDTTAITIGNSYTRYWLPCFVLLTPLIATTLSKFFSFFSSRSIKVFLMFFCCLILGIANVYSVFFSSEDALWPMRVRLAKAAEIHDQVMTLTETQAVIVVDRGDKLFFPDRRVRYPLRDETTYSLLPSLATQVPLYYYGITLPEKDINYLNSDKLKTMGLQIELIKNFGEESLYKIFFFSE